MMLGKGNHAVLAMCHPVTSLPASLQPFAGGGYRLGATPEEESAYVAGERRQNSVQDVSVFLLFCSGHLGDCSATSKSL